MSLELYVSRAIDARPRARRRIIIDFRYPNSILSICVDLQGCWSTMVHMIMVTVVGHMLARILFDLKLGTNVW